MAENNNRRISNTTAGLMLVVALLFDLLELVLVLAFGSGLLINRIIVVVKWLLFMWWLHRKGASFFKGPAKKGVTAIITFITGFIPILGALPEFTLGLFATIIMIRGEDIVGVSFTPPKPAAAANVKGRLARARAQTQRRVRRARQAIRDPKRTFGTLERFARLTKHQTGFGEAKQRGQKIAARRKARSQAARAPSPQPKPRPQNTDVRALRPKPAQST